MVGFVCGIHFPILFSGVYVKTCNINPKKDIPPVSVSPFHFKMFQNDEFTENNSLDVVKSHGSHKRKDSLQRISSNAEMGISDWSMHEKIIAALSLGSLDDEAKETHTTIGEAHKRVSNRSGLSSLLRAWCRAQFDIIVSNSGEDVNSLVIGCKTLIHVKVKNHTILRHKMIQTSSCKNRNQAEEPSVDVLYIFSLSEDSPHDDIHGYEIAFDKSSLDKYSSRSLDKLLGNLQEGDIVSFPAAYERRSDNFLSADISSLDWMGAAPSDVNYSRYLSV